MTTKVYGASDDCIEFEGDVYGEVTCFGTDDRDRGVLIVFSDGTVLEAKFGKFWGMALIRSGDLSPTVVACTGEEPGPRTDVVLFEDGLKWAYAATEWDQVYTPDVKTGA